MKRIVKIGAILALIALFLDCNEGSNTIFYNIINDTPVNNNNQLGNSSNVRSMTKIGTTYYATAGMIRYRAETASIWSYLTLASGMHHTVATDGTNLYAGIWDDGPTTGLYQYNPGTQVTTKITSILYLRSVGKIKNFGTAVYASYQKNGTPGPFSLCSISGTTATELPGMPVLSPSINDLASDGTNVYFTSGSSVFRWTPPNTVNEITPAGPAYTFTGIGYDSNLNRVMASTLDGYLYRSSDAIGDSWETVYGQFSYTRSGVTTAVPFTGFASLPASANRLLVGSEGAGFWEIDTSAGGFIVTRWNGSSYSELYNGVIESIFVDGATDPRVFFCTVGAGLWDNVYYATGWGGTWTRE